MALEEDKIKGARASITEPHMADKKSPVVKTAPKTGILGIPLIKGGDRSKPTPRPLGETFISKETKLNSLKRGVADPRLMSGARSALRNEITQPSKKEGVKKPSYGGLQSDANPVVKSPLRSSNERVIGGVKQYFSPTGGDLPESRKMISEQDRADMAKANERTGIFKETGSYRDQDNILHTARQAEQAPAPLDGGIFSDISGLSGDGRNLKAEHLTAVRKRQEQARRDAPLNAALNGVRSARTRGELRKAQAVLEGLQKNRGLTKDAEAGRGRTALNQAKTQKAIEETRGIMSKKDDLTPGEYNRLITEKVLGAKTPDEQDTIIGGIYPGFNIEGDELKRAYALQGIKDGESSVEALNARMKESEAKAKNNS